MERKQDAFSLQQEYRNVNRPPAPLYFSYLQVSTFTIYYLCIFSQKAAGNSASNYATGYCMLQTGPGMKSVPIQMYKNILTTLKNNTCIRSYFDTEAVDWVDKYFQIGSAYYFTQSDSEKQIG